MIGMVSYQCAIVTLSLVCTIFEIFTEGVEGSGGCGGRVPLPSRLGGLGSVLLLNMVTTLTAATAEIYTVKIVLKIFEVNISGRGLIP